MSSGLESPNSLNMRKFRRTLKEEKIKFKPEAKPENWYISRIIKLISRLSPNVLNIRTLRKN